MDEEVHIKSGLDWSVPEEQINIFAIGMLWVCGGGDIWLDVGANVGCAGNERSSPSPNNHQW